MSIQGILRNVVVGIGILAAVAVIAGNAASEEKVDRPAYEGPPLVRIDALQARLELVNVYPAAPGVDPDRFIGQPNGSFSVTVESQMPAWGVMAAAQHLRGSGQDLDGSRLWLRSDQSADTFVSLRDNVRLLNDDGYSPGYQTDIEVAVRPSWSDPTGSYTGELLLSPVLNGGGDDPALAAGQPHTIEFGFVIPEVIELHLSGSSIVFSKIEGPGLYSADEDLIVRVATNSRSWRVVADGSDLVALDGHVIESSRIRWQLFSPASTDNEIATGVLGKETVFYEGTAPTESMDMRLAFEVDVQLRDHAGAYAADLRMSGEVTPTADVNHY